MRLLLRRRSEVHRHPDPLLADRGRELVGTDVVREVALGHGPDDVDFGRGVSGQKEVRVRDGGGDAGAAADDEDVGVGGEVEFFAVGPFEEEGLAGGGYGDGGGEEFGLEAAGHAFVGADEHLEDVSGVQLGEVGFGTYGMRSVGSGLVDGHGAHRAAHLFGQARFRWRGWMRDP